MEAAAAGTWLRVPSPKRMRAAVANSKGGMGRKTFHAKTQGRKEKLGKAGDRGWPVSGRNGFTEDLLKRLCMF
jgi:hypothetical protein